MHRFVALVALAVLVVALPAAHTIAGKTDKVDVCHMGNPNAYGYLEFDNLTYDIQGIWYYYPGKVISVDADAVNDHTGHGDRVMGSGYYDGRELTDYARGYISSVEDLVGTTVTSGGQEIYYPDGQNAIVKNKDCYWVVYESLD